MDQSKRVDIFEQLGRLSPKESIYDEMESSKILENVIGFVPTSDGADTNLLVANLGVHLAGRGLSVCILDANVFFPSVYKVIDCETTPKGKGLLSVLRSDKLDYREEFLKTRFKNLYLMSASLLDPLEEYLDIKEEDYERVIFQLKEIFDLVLVCIPNNPPLEFCYVSIKSCDMGFMVWTERADCPLNSSRLMQFLSSINIGVSKFANVIINNEIGVNFDKEVISEMNLKLIAEFPLVPSAIDLSLEGKVYINESSVMDKRYKKALTRLADLIEG